MAKHLKRTPTAHLEELTQWGGARSTKWVLPPDGTSVLEIQTTHTPEVFKDVPDDQNVLVPPFHWHWYQDEYFHIKEGRYIFTLEDKTIVVTAADPQPVTVPAKARHTFKVDPTCPAPCTIEISTTISPRNASSGLRRSTNDEIEPDQAGASEGFFRNIYGYLEDCNSQKVAPSLPQLLLMLHDAEVSLAFPGPPLVAQWASWAFGLVLGKGLGQYVLGYSSDYPEYYDASRRELVVKRAAGARGSKKTR